MQLQWLEDLLAVLETPSLNAAAERRHVTQPAFSRRLRLIEAHVRGQLIDRSRKPARALPALQSRHGQIRELVDRHKALMHELRRDSATAQDGITIAAQYAITMILSPELLTSMFERVSGNIVLKTANRDECMAWLLSGQVDLTLTYQSPHPPAVLDQEMVEERSLLSERMCPVIAPSALARLRSARKAGELPVIAYPADMFLGQVFASQIEPQLDANLFVRRKAETGLTLAALQMAAAGVGVAWIPHALARRELAAGVLVDLGDSLPSCVIEIVAARRARAGSATVQAVWSSLPGQ